ncbi:hypothetical protein LJR030_004616 [Rhizobium sp. LjRoot30]|uniref:hypothetical protein n=1 Tax=Rhizobium sp. LjRoot30 TaxID=3342320 RepID=UPI003ECD1B66
MSFLQTDFSQAGFIAARERSPADTARTILLLAIGLQIAFMLPSAIAYFLDQRQIDGVSVWSKPLKFELSIIITVATVVILLPLLDAAKRASRAVRWSSHVIAIAATLEIAYIVVQAARGRASHFNTETPAESVAYSLMGIGAVSIVVGCFVVGWVIWRSGRRDAGIGLRLGAASGLMIGAVLTVITAGILSSGALAEPGHWVGGVRSDAEGLFLVGWSRSGGDLRVPHFFATHLMQALPLLGLMLDRFSPERARLGIWLGTFAGMAVVAATFVQAASGNPFL